jgi:predicted neuraminidase
LSYPSIYVENSDSTDIAHVAYTWHRQHIKYVRIDDVEGWVSS